MENQHQKIKGYRELSQVEIDLMNRIKEFGPQLQTLIDELHEHIKQQYEGATKEEDQRLMNANPGRWVNVGATDLQKGLMALTRAVAQPTFF